MLHLGRVWVCIVAPGLETNIGSAFVPALWRHDAEYYIGIFLGTGLWRRGLECNIGYFSGVHWGLTISRVAVGPS